MVSPLSTPWRSWDPNTSPMSQSMPSHAPSSPPGMIAQTLSDELEGNLGTTGWNTMANPLEGAPAGDYANQLNLPLSASPTLADGQTTQDDQGNPIAALAGAEMGQARSQEAPSDTNSQKSFISSLFEAGNGNDSTVASWFASLPWWIILLGVVFLGGLSMLAGLTLVILLTQWIFGLGLLSQFWSKNRRSSVFQHDTATPFRQYETAHGVYHSSLHPVSSPEPHLAQADRHLQELMHLPVTHLAPTGSDTAHTRPVINYETSSQRDLKSGTNSHRKPSPPVYLVNSSKSVREAIRKGVSLQLSQG